MAGVSPEGLHPTESPTPPTHTGAEPGESSRGMPLPVPLLPGPRVPTHERQPQGPRSLDEEGHLDGMDDGLASESGQGSPQRQRSRSREWGDSTGDMDEGRDRRGESRDRSHSSGPGNAFSNSQRGGGRDFRGENGEGEAQGNRKARKKKQQGQGKGQNSKSGKPEVEDQQIRRMMALLKQPPIHPTPLEAYIRNTLHHGGVTFHDSSKMTQIATNMARRVADGNFNTDAGMRSVLDELGNREKDGEQICRNIAKIHNTSRNQFSNQPYQKGVGYKRR
jgi:hypothetical protein